MLYLHTGAPGAGKTLSAVEFITKVQAEDSARVVYSNVNGITLPGVVVVDDDWMAEWWDRASPGALIVIDEAQKIWRSTRGGGEPGKAITDLETHRHDGIDIVMITQHPTLIHANIRKLVTCHVHVVEYTKDSALRWQWRECHDDVQDKQLRQSGEFKEWKYPKHLYEFYTSAFQHTKRTKRPRAQVRARILGGISAVLVLGLIGVLAWHAPEVWRKAKGIGGTQQAAGASPAQQSPSPDSGRPSTPHTAAEYIAQQMPRVQQQPWSAPIYDGQAVTQHPQVWCIAQEQPAKCRCITDQGTHYTMADDVCRVYAAEGGTYDPYKPAPKEDRTAAAAQSQMAPAAPSQDVASTMGGAGLPDGVVAPRGAAQGVGSQQYTPPGYGNWNANYFGGGSK